MMETKFKIYFFLIFLCFFTDVSSAQSVLRSIPQNTQQVQISYAPLVKTSVPAVVNVYATIIEQNQQNYSVFDFFFGNSIPAVPNKRFSQSLGSGVIVDKSGLIVTNYHVVKHAKDIKVILADRREYSAKIIIADIKTDLAVLGIKEKNVTFPTIKLANSNQLQVGDIVIAIGNPFGVGQTVTSGIISALARNNVVANEYEYFIQTDAAINMGNSGGALIDMQGDLIGINTAIFSRSGGSNGIGFAVPANLVKQVIKAAKSGKQILRPWLGAKTEDIDYSTARYLKLSRPIGALINDIYSGATADKAGLKVGDLITKINNSQLADNASLQFRIATKEIGTTAKIEFLRDGKKRSTVLKFEPLSDKPKPEKYMIDADNPLYGVTIANLSPAFNNKNNIDSFATGVAIISLNSRSLAARYGLRPGQIIKEINGKKTSNVKEIKSLLKMWDSSLWVVKLEGSNGKILTWRLQ